VALCALRADEQKKIAAGKLEAFRIAGMVRTIHKKSGGYYNSHYRQLSAMKTRAANSLKNLAGPTGLEPATSCVTGRRSNQLNYGPALCT
jgi:hypothetical protein